MKEAIFQKRLIGDMKDAGLRVKKMQSGMGYTVLDLYVVHHGYGPMWIELKTVPTLGTKVELSALQKRDIELELEFGSVAGCVVCCKDAATGDEAVYWFNPNRVHIDKFDLITTRKRGEKFDVEAIVATVHKRARPARA